MFKFFAFPSPVHFPTLFDTTIISLIMPRYTTEITTTIPAQKTKQNRRECNIGTDTDRPVHINPTTVTAKTSAAQWAAFEDRLSRRLYDMYTAIEAARHASQACSPSDALRPVPASTTTSFT